MKLCKDCKHYEYVGPTSFLTAMSFPPLLTVHLCHHPELSNRVTGAPIDAMGERGTPHGGCGMIGKMFEPKLDDS